MSPIGGVGINLAVQDAVAAANILLAAARGRLAQRKRSACGRAAARVSDPRHPAPAGARSEQGHRPRARRARGTAPAAPFAARVALCVAAPHSGAARRPGRAARARAHAGSARSANEWLARGRHCRARPGTSAVASDVSDQFHAPRIGRLNYNRRRTSENDPRKWICKLAQPGPANPVGSGDPVSLEARSERSFRSRPGRILESSCCRAVHQG